MRGRGVGIFYGCIRVAVMSSYDMFAINLASVLVTKREHMYGIELIIIITTASVLAYSGFSPGVIGILVVWWFVGRVSVKEDFPLSAVITSEFASTSTGSRSRFMPRLFTPQGWGNLADSLAALVNGIPRDARESRNGRKTRAERRREQAGASGRPGSLR
ncbi:hypothetical protein BC827DRAFT_311160 [Russula dissimulans]|nr:hypothetical protein BC827DRAFT_311160 [Russula dissimulans]